MINYVKLLWMNINKYINGKYNYLKSYMKSDTISLLDEGDFDSILKDYIKNSKDIKCKKCSKILNIEEVAAFKINNDRIDVFCKECRNMEYIKSME